MTTNNIHEKNNVHVPYVKQQFTKQKQNNNKKHFIILLPAHNPIPASPHPRPLHTHARMRAGAHTHTHGYETGSGCRFNKYYLYNFIICIQGMCTLM